MSLRKAALAALCLSVSSHAALAACADAREVSALKIAALQQRLMVAGLVCPSLNGKGAGDAYNRFVLAHRAELQRSDDDLKAYFVKNGGEAGYDAYKTRMANLAAHGPATDQNAFCAVAAKDFRDLANSGDLQMAASYESMLTGKACETPVLAAAKPEAAPVRLASADMVAAPQRSLPAMPYADAAPPTPRALPAMPYADAPPPAPMPQPVVATARDYADAPRAEAPSPRDYVPRDYEDATPAPVTEEVAAPPPRPADQRDSRYWYYRQLYRDYYRGH
jgi:hypothetical protein